MMAKLIKVLLGLVSLFLVTTSFVFAAGTDVNNDGVVNAADLIKILQNWGLSGSRLEDINQDQKVNLVEAGLVIRDWGKTIETPTPYPTVPPSSGEWTQHGHDAQHTGYTNQVVETPWRWKWAWNGPDASGGISAGKTSLPRNVQPVTGGGRVYIARGSGGVYALNEGNGSVIWNKSPGGDINSTPAYDSQTGAVFVLSSNGTLYKLDASNGNTLGQLSTGSSSNLSLPPALIGDRVFISMGNSVYAINKNTMQSIWQYNAGTTVQTPPAYSQSRNRVVVGTSDLYIHAINNTNGSQAWRQKPTVRGSGEAEWARGWPVIADAHGYVLVKLKLDWDTLWTWNPWPTTNAQIRANLQSQPNQQALFVLNLDNGNVPFISNVGHGGWGDGGNLPMGPQPVVKRLADGKEVVYMIGRGDNQYDGRWDSKFVEMLLDSTTVSGYSGGEVRFIEYNGSVVVTDEQPNVSMAGDYLFGGHWMAGLALKITNRADQYGAYSNRIKAENAPHFTTSASNCGFSASHYCSQGLTQDGDPRSYPAGFYIYYNQGTVYDRYWSGYSTWVVSNNTVYFRGCDGAIIALEHGNPTAFNPQSGEVAGLTAETGQSRSGLESAVISYEEARNYTDEVKTIEGVLRYIFNNHQAVYLGFRNPHQGELVVRIMKENWDQFPAPPEDLYLLGQKIQVTGKIEWYQGDPVIYVRSPGQIKND